jgi:hypothetical protein
LSAVRGNWQRREQRCRLLIGQSPQIGREAGRILDRPAGGQLPEDVVLIGMRGGQTSPTRATSAVT